MSGPGAVPEWSPEFKIPEGWQPNTTTGETLPRSSVGTYTLPDGGIVPTYYCVLCEEKSALEGRPITADHLKRFGPNATIHICWRCEYVREVAYPADAKGPST